jgi:predicted DNA-binding transcriptional regulator YafY
MPKNKNAQLRYQIIDRCLKNHSIKWTWQNLLDKINEELLEKHSDADGISKSMFFKDIENMQEVYEEIEIEKIKDGKTKYYRYSETSKSINEQPLNETEVMQLKSATMVLSRFKGMPQFEWVNEIIPLLESKMGLVKTDKEVITFESNPDYIGLPHIPILFNAIANKRVLEITYRNFKSSVAYDVELHPYHLRQYNSRWFVFGYSSSWPDKIQNLALDRIKKIEELPIKYRKDDTNWDDYFADMIGVTKFNLSPVEIKLHITDAEQAAYIQTKPIHQTQKQLRQVENGYETSIKIIPNYELESLLLSFGERIKIISPKSVQEKIKKRVNQMVLNYSEKSQK